MAPLDHTRGEWVRKKIVLALTAEKSHTSSQYALALAWSWPQCICSVYTVYMQCIHSVYAVYMQCIHSVYAVYMQCRNGKPVYIGAYNFLFTSFKMKSQKVRTSRIRSIEKIQLFKTNLCKHYVYIRNNDGLICYVWKVCLLLFCVQLNNTAHYTDRKKNWFQ